MPYDLVIPRDLFNQSKLLKCIGQVALLIHGGNGGRWNLRFDHDTEWTAGFEIDQQQSDGSLFIANMPLLAGRPDDPYVIELASVYNSKAPYPLQFRIEDGEGNVHEGSAMTDEGRFTSEFCDILDKVIR